MLDGSLTIRRSIPRADMAARVLARRWTYSARVKFRSGSLMVSTLSPGSTVEGHAGAGRDGARAGEGRDRRILYARSGEVADQIGRASCRARGCKYVSISWDADT